MLPSRGLYNPYHLLKESEKSIDHLFILIGIIMIISSGGNNSNSNSNSNRSNSNRSGNSIGDRN